MFPLAQLLPSLLGAQRFQPWLTSLRPVAAQRCAEVPGQDRDEGDPGLRGEVARVREGEQGGHPRVHQGRGEALRRDGREDEGAPEARSFGVFTGEFRSSDFGMLRPLRLGFGEFPFSLRVR